MSRPLLILVLVIVAILGLLIWLANVDTQVPVGRIQVPVTPNAAQPK